MQSIRAALGRAPLHKSDGQAVVLMAVVLAVLLGAAGLVLDVGSWYRADRATATGGPRRWRGRSA